ncbi:hypothetical protein ACT540_01010 [Pediococcus pentosaceus]
MIVEVHHLLHPRSETTTHITTKQAPNSGFSKYMDKKVGKLSQTNTDLKNENLDFTIYDVAKQKRIVGVKARLAKCIQQVPLKFQF